jgi:hypothetical protein
MRTPARTRGARWAICGAAALVIISAVWLGLRFALPGDGAPWRQDPGFSGGVTVDAAAPGQGLRSGDVVYAVDGLPLDRWLASNSPHRPGLVSGARLTYSIRRRGVALEVPVRLIRSVELGSRLRHEGGVGVAALALLLIGGLTIRRRPDHAAAHALLLFGAGLVTSFVFASAAPWEVAELVTTPWLFDLGMFGAVPGFVILAAALAHLTWTFPSSPRFLDRYRWLVGVLYAIVLAATLGVLLVYLLIGHATLVGLQDWYTATGFVLSGLAAIALFGVARTAVRAVRNRDLRFDWSLQRSLSPSSG